jgi:hypothetical protein
LVNGPPPSGSADWLVLAVERRAEVNPALVDLQQAHLARREAGGVADFDVVAAGGGVGHDAVGQLHAHRPRVAEVVLQPRRQRLHRLRRVQCGLLVAEDRLV